MLQCRMLNRRATLSIVHSTRTNVDETVPTLDLSFALFSYAFLVLFIRFVIRPSQDTFLLANFCRDAVERATAE